MTIRLEAISRLVIQPLTYTFQSGLCYGISGDNGAGKTTLLRMLAGLDPPTSGRIFYRDQALTDQLIRDPGIVYVAPKPFLFRGTVLHNLHLPLKSRKVPKTQRDTAIDPLLKALGLWELRHRTTQKLSSGEMQKVALIRALALKPAVLLLDEPTSNLDKETTEAVEKLLKEMIKTHKTTILMVSHDHRQMMRMAHRVLRLKGGVVDLENLDDDIKKDDRHVERT